MRDFLILSRALFKNTYSFKTHKWRNIGLIALLSVSILPLLAILYFSSLSIFTNSNLGLMYLQAYFVLVNMIVLWTVLFVFPSTFYFANDIPKLIVLPIPSWAIVASKTLLVYVSALLIDLIGLVPCWIAWIQSGAPIASSLIFLLQIFLNTLPTLFVIGIVTILAMRFVPFFKNKDRFMMVLGIVSMFAAVAISVASQSIANSQGEIFINLLRNDPELIGNAMKIFFQVPSVSESIWNSSLVQLLISIGIDGLLGALFLLLARSLYLPVAMTMQASPRRKNKKKSLKATSPILSYTKVELKTLLRTPSYITNGVLSSLIMPIMMVVIVLVNPEIRTLLPMIKSIDLAELIDLWPTFFLFGGISGFFLGSTNGICATSFSRQGRNLDFVKYIPMPMAKQIEAKLLVGILFSMLSSILLLLPAHYIFTYAYSYDLAYLLGALLSTILVNQIAILIDGIHPKIDWEDETAVMKNNLNVLAELFLSWLILGLFVGLYFLIDSLLVFAIAASLCLIALIVVLYLISPKIIMNHLMKL